MNQLSMAILSTRKLESKMKALTDAWENFISGNSSEQDMRSVILGSWKRCQEFGVNPKQQQTTLSLSDTELTDLLKTSTLYQTAKPIMDKLTEQLIDTGYLITLTDSQGRIIYLRGERRVLSEGEKMNFVQGADWSEHAAGTNAIGTSIVTKKPVQIFSAEHFCQGCHQWICSSAPILDPLTGQVIGVLDLTGLWYEAQPHSLGLVASHALHIQQLLAQNRREWDHCLLERYHQASLRWPNDTIVLMDARFQVRKRNREFFQNWNLNQPDWLQRAEWKPLKDELISLATRDVSNADICIHPLQARAYIERISLNGQPIGFLVVLRQQYTALPKPLYGWRDLLGESPEFRKIIQKCQTVSEVNVNVLITGESGTGKEKVARAIHNNSSRSRQPFVAINCGAIPKELIASELFGYEPGTFTGGNLKGKKGKFEEANLGTIFLDEIGEMPLDLQVHLLRVLQEKEVVRLGSSKPIPVDVRIIAATNRDLKDMVAKGNFRSDLYFRLNTVSIHLPPLRERKDDILLLARHFLEVYSRKYDKPQRPFSSEALAFFRNYSWPGNIRELQNVVEHAVLFATSDEIVMDDLPQYLTQQPKPCDAEPTPALSHLSLIEQEEKKMLERLLLTHRGNLSEIARECKIARTTLYRKLRKYQLMQPSR